jgi:hypothetical protein
MLFIFTLVCNSKAVHCLRNVSFLYLRVKHYLVSVLCNTYVFRAALICGAEQHDIPTACAVDGHMLGGKVYSAVIGANIVILIKNFPVLCGERFKGLFTCLSRPPLCFIYVSGY